MVGLKAIKVRGLVMKNVTIDHPDLIEEGSPETLFGIIKGRWWNFINFPWLLLYYAGRRFLNAVFLMLILLGGLAFLVDMIELFRRSSNKAQTKPLDLLLMSLLKLPALSMEMMPLVVMFGALLALWSLARTQELVVARSAGVSAWQLLGGPLLVAFMLGILMMFFINPLASSLRSIYEEKENMLLENRVQQIEISATGLWLREQDSKQVVVVNADSLNIDQNSFKGVRLFAVRHDGSLITRIDATEAFLTPRGWLFPKANVFQPEQRNKIVGDYLFPSSLSMQSIEKQFRSSESLSFWDLRDFAAKMRSAGLNDTSYRLRFHALLSLPLLYMAMVLIASLFTIRTGRMIQIVRLVTSAVVVAFGLYFSSNLIQALGLSQIIPAALAGWLPALISILLAIALLLHYEDG